MSGGRFATLAALIIVLAGGAGYYSYTRVHIIAQQLKGYDAKIAAAQAAAAAAEGTAAQAKAAIDAATAAANNATAAATQASNASAEAIKAMADAQAAAKATVMAASPHKK